jgi:hypothetical protein
MDLFKDNKININQICWHACINEVGDIYCDKRKQEIEKYDNCTVNTTMEEKELLLVMKKCENYCTSPKSDLEEHIKGK